MVNVGSLAGDISLPFFGVYSATKHAVEAISDSMRVELSAFNISVSLVKPGSVRTSIVDEMSSQLDSTECLSPLYDSHLTSFKKTFDLANRYKELVMSTTEATTDAIKHALTSKAPHTRYLVGMDAKVIHFLDWLLPDRIMDLFYKL